MLKKFNQSLRHKNNVIISSNIQSNILQDCQLFDYPIILPKFFRMTLANIFDLFDFDENGTLNRTEFDIYNVVTSNDHVTDKVIKIFHT